jgi:hypothetical protein
MWNLPALLCVTTRHHHSPDETSTHTLECALIHLANRIANAVEADAAQVDLLVPPEATAWKAAGLAPDELEPTLQALHAQFEETLHLINPAAAGR